MAKQLQLRRGNLSWWTTNNPVLADGEMVLVSTTNDYVYDQYRIGDGLNTFSSLAIHSFPFNTTIEQFLADAEAARDAAQLAETNAETAEANAEAAEALAEKWATNPEDVAVESGKYSALHWSAKAEDEKIAAEVHKNKADKFANENEDVLVEAGKYSAKHYSLKAAAQNAQMGAVYPTAAYRSRVLADSGNIQDLNKLTELYIKNLQLLDSTVFLWSGVSGMKTRTSGSNQFANKLYNMANLVQQFGSELVTNGTFTTDTSVWTWIRTTLAVDTNRLKLTSTETSTNAYAYQAITTIIGKTYHLSYAITTGTLAGSMYIGTTVGGGQIFTDIGFNGTKTISFVATATTTYVNLMLFNNTLGQYAFFDNISVKQMDWVAGANDAVQATEANQPYVCGVIAPNEVRKLKNLSVSEDRKMSISAIEFADNSSFSISFNCKLLTNTTEQVIIGYAQSSGFSRISILGFGLNIRNRYGGSDVVISNIYTNSEIGKSIQFTIVYNNGVYSLYKNGVYFNSISGTGGALYNQLFVAGNTTLDFVSELIHLQIHNRALSASEIQAQHDYLRLQIPEIEGIAIGNQYWTTSNYEGVVAGDGSVIPEVQEANNVDKLSGTGNFENGLIGTKTDADGVVSTWSLNTTNPISGTQDGRLVVSTTGVGGNSQYRPILSIPLTFIVGRSYLVKFDYKVNSGTVIWTGVSKGSGQNDFFYTQLTGTGNAQRFIHIADTASSGILLYFNGQNLFDLQIDNISVEEVGWSQSTALYDAIYAQTSGTTAQKELAALKAAAMWCYYNNDVNIGATRGKIINDYAKALIALYPPVGYRVPSEADVNQLIAYNGGSSVAGGKLKKEGFGYWNSPNTGATNESGFSAIAGGRRAADGTFGLIGDQAFFGTSTADKRLNLTQVSAATNISNEGRERGYSLRLLRNSPVGPNERTITSTTIVSDIASTANSTQIPFGYSVASIRLRTTANLTNIKVELWNNFYSGTPTLVSTLITGKTANNTTMVFPVLADATALLQDGTLRITATGANTFETIVEYNLQKNTF